MVRRERGPWLRKLLVEDCRGLDISRLARAGVFRAETGTLCTTVWNDRTGREIYRVYFWLESTNASQSVLRVVTDARDAIGRRCGHNGQAIPIVQTQLYFGPRRYLLCPGVRDNIPCGKRTRILYLPPNAHQLRCRTCHNLIYRSAKKHDARIDKLLRLPPEEFREVLASGSIRQQLLAVRASAVLLQRIQRKAARYTS